MRQKPRSSPCLYALFTLCLLAATRTQAQSACAPNVPGVVTPSPAIFTANQPFTFTVLICPVVAQNIGVPVQFTIQGPSGVLVQQQTTTDANATASITVAAGLPKGGYSLNIVATDPPYDYSYTGYGFTVYPPPITTLTGNYSFLLQGVGALYTPPGAPVQIGLAGAFLADGNGSIHGEVDINSTYGVLEHAALTGTYSLNPAGRGTITLVTPIGPQTLTLTAPTNQMYYQIQSAILTSQPGSAIVGSGTLAQRVYDYSYVPTQTPTFITQLRGESACDTTCLAANGQAQLLTGSGTLSLNYNAPLSYSLIFNQTAGPAPIPQLTESGTLTTYDSYGRAVLNQTSGGVTGSPSRFAIYRLDGDDLYLLSLTPHDQANLMSGSLAAPY